MGFSEKTVYAMIESIVLGEKFKPIQKCIRRCLSKYGIIGTPIDRKASAIVYNVFRSLGLNDRI
ncbi:MAG TPA: Fmu (Sun) domain-containing protein, partial [Desulfurococcales archaeon]|nr:Fmu (Sun) domain-containing protein [Desulfurococcales archaeon]